MVRSVDIEKILEFGARYVTNKQAAGLEDEVLDRLIHPNIFGKQAALKMGESSDQPSSGQPGGKNKPPAGGEEPATGIDRARTGTGSEGSPGGNGSKNQDGTQGSTGTGTGAARTGTGAAGIGAGAARTGTGATRTGTGAPGPLPGSGAPSTQKRIEYDTERSGLQTIPGAELRPDDATDPEGQSEIRGSFIDQRSIEIGIQDARKYRNAEGAAGFQADADLLREAIKNLNNNQWLQQNENKVNEALKRVFEYGALQWATGGFQITDPAVVNFRMQKLYDVVLRNGRLDPRDLDLVYSRFTRQLGLPAREVVTDPTTGRQVTVKNSTTFEMFQNWMNSPEVPWWHKAALIIGIPLAFAGLITKLAGGSTEASLALGGTGLLLSGLGGFFAYTGARDLENKRITERTEELRKEREEQAKYDALDALYSSFGPEGKDFSDRFFNQKDGKPLVLDAKDIFPSGIFTTQAVEEFLNLADASGKRKEAERILFTLDILQRNFSEIRQGDRRYLSAVKLMQRIEALPYNKQPFKVFSSDFTNLLAELPSHMKGRILGEMGYDPASKLVFKYLEHLGTRPGDIYSVNRKPGSIFGALILGEATPEQLLREIDQTYPGVIIKDTINLSHRALGQTPNRHCGVLIARKSWQKPWLDWIIGGFTDQGIRYDEQIIKPSIEKAIRESGVTYTDLAFLNSLVLYSENLVLFGDQKYPANNKKKTQARLVGDILNTGLIPPISSESDRRTYEAIYGKDTTYLSVPNNSLKTFIQITKNNMDYVLEDSDYKSLADLMIHDLRKHGVKSSTMGYIENVVTSSSFIPQEKKESVIKDLEQLAIQDPAAAVSVLGMFNPMIEDQINDYQIYMEQPGPTRKLAESIKTKIRNIANINK